MTLPSSPAAAQKALLTAIAGDHLSGLVLNELVYWFSPSKKDGKARVRVTKNGKFWWACHRSHWEEMGITRHQYQRVIDHLKAKRLLETSRTLFDGKVTPLLRLNNDRLEELTIHYLESGQSIDRFSANRLSENRPIDCPKIGQSITVSSTTTFNTAFSSAAPNSSEPEQHPKERVKKQAKQEPSPEQKPKVSLALMKKLHPELADQPMKAADILHKRSTHVQATFAARWKNEVSGLTGEFTPALTIKESKHLNDVGKALEGSRYNAMEVLTFAIRNWTSFATRAAQNSGQSIAPQKPVVAFYFKHYATALQLMDAAAEREKAEAKAAAKLKETPVPSPKKSPVATPLPDGDYMPSDEEVAQMIAEAKKAAESKG